MNRRIPIARASLFALVAVNLAGCIDERGPTPRDLRVRPTADQPEGEPIELSSPPGEPLPAIDCTEKTDTGYVKGNPFPITVVTVDGKPVEKDTANAYYAMQQAAAQAGVNIAVVSGFRTWAQQEYLYNCYINCNCNNCNLAAKPGYSNHQSGHALNLNTKNAGVYTWLANNGGAYGFEETVQGEPWHWEWWGDNGPTQPCGGCEPHCEGTKIVSEDCSEGDCAVYGANCVDDDLEPRCVFFACPAQGTAKVCVDETIIGDCVDGQIMTGDCADFAAYCSTKFGDEARCVSVFCAEPEQTPFPHDGCFFDGNPYHCDEFGQITSEPCPPGEECTVYPTVHCQAGLGCPETGGGTVCLDATAIGVCHEGAVVDAADCGDFGGFCSTAGNVPPHCVASFCVSGPDEVPEEHAVCLPDGNLGLCLGDGSLKTSECPAGTHCIEGDFGAACVEDTVTGSGGSDSGSGGQTGSSSTTAGTSSSGSGGSGGGSGANSSPGSATATWSGGQDDDADGCSCTTEDPQRGYRGLVLAVVVGLHLRRRRPRQAVHARSP